MDQSADQAEPAKQRFQTLRGMRDILPEDAAYYRHVENIFWNVAKRHGFEEIRTPVVEQAELFARTVGEGTDIIHKEMYVFKDRSDNNVALRPEGTAAVGRAYLEHGMGSRPQPVKLAYVCNMYRYERPQAGRYREHEQFGLEAFGSADPTTDAQIILAAWQVYQELGLKDLSVQINSIGGAKSRRAIRTLITDSLRPVADRLSDDARRQLKDNPLRVLDSKDPDTMKLIERIPPLIDQLTKEDSDHFQAVLEYLDEIKVPYELNPRLVRGLDYYTQTVFEVWGGAGGQSALGAGGRYDGLIAELGGPSTPGVGMGSGIDRLVDMLKAGQGSQPAQDTAQVFVVQLGTEAKRIAFDLMDQLTKENISVTSAQGKEGIRAQLKTADKLGVPLALIIGQKEAMDNTVIIRDMVSGIQDTAQLENVGQEVKRRIPSAVTMGTKTNPPKA